MSENGELKTKTAVRFERLVPGPIERVWEFLTSSEHLPDWFGKPGMKYLIEPFVGGKVNLQDGHIQGVVTQWKPPKLLAYTWNVFGPGDAESPYPESYLTFELQPKDDQVQLTLTHLPVLEGFDKQTMMGWHTFLERLAGLLSGNKLDPLEVTMERNRARYGVEQIRK